MKIIKIKWALMMVLIPLVATLSFYIDSIRLRWKLRQLPNFDQITFEEQIIIISTYDNYALRPDKNIAIKDDYEYAMKYLVNTSNVKDKTYSMYSNDEYTSVWQFGEGYYRLSMVYDSGYKNLTLKVGRGKFTDNPLFRKAVIVGSSVTF